MEFWNNCHRISNRSSALSQIPSHESNYSWKYYVGFEIWLNGMGSGVLLDIVVFLLDLRKINGGMQTSEMLSDVLSGQDRTEVVQCSALKLALFAFSAQS